MLQDLHLSYSSPRDDTKATILFDAASGLHADFLPNLQVFRGHSANIEMMARTRMRCLTRLQELTIGYISPSSDTAIDSIDRMLDAVEASGGLDALKTLDFDIFRWEEVERDFLPTFVKRLGALCGSTLEVWSGLLPFTGSWPLDVFASFPRLRVIDFPSDPGALRFYSLRRNTEYALFEDHVRRIAGICHVLEEVNIISSRNREDECWKVYRPVSGLTVQRVD
jgi:hypothetical protein